jgi:pimeloyl-ACP methyl ester carboxylesterase
MAVYSQYKSEEARERAFKSYDSMLAHWQVPCETRFVDTTFGPTHLIACGPAEAPPVVLLHGAGGNATGWIWNVGGLADRYQVYALDTIGDFGKSAGTRPAYSSGDHARWLSEVFERLGLGRARVAGLSLGGWIAFHFALAAPERVERLVLMAPASLQRMNAKFMFRGGLAMMFPRAAIVRSFFRYLASREYPGMPAHAMDALIVQWQAGRPNSVQVPVIRDVELSALHVPTLVLLGSEDPIYDADKAASRVRAVAPQIQIEIIPDAGHLFPIERPEATNKALVKFFA